MSTARRTSRNASRQTLRGKRSVQKGRRFEDRVADLYRLLGAEVIQNIEVCQKKVDVLATFPLPGSATPHRVIVECKSEKTAVAQNQRVMQFAGLLDLARKSGEAESAEIVTEVGWSDQAKAFARSRQIALHTYEQKVSRLINFEPYLKALAREYEEGTPSSPALASYYVAPTAKVLGAKSRTIRDLEKYIREWLRAQGIRQLAVLGEYGTGKTCLCRKLAHDFASAYLANQGTTRIPLLFNLRDFTKTLTIESLITSFLDAVCGVTNPRFQLFKAMNEAGVFLLILDGFDEMAVRVDADTLEVNLREIEKLANTKKSRVLLTCRTEYFVNAEEQSRVLQPRGRLLATRDVEYQPLLIEPWDDAKVEQFLRRRVPLIPGKRKEWTFYRDQLRSIPGLSDLARRPVLLEMIVKTLPQLIASGEPINRPNLYHTYLIGELKRQKIVKQRIFLLSESTRLAVLQNLAAKFYEQDNPAITFSEAMNEVEAAVHPPRSELEAHTRDFLNCSFLVREGDTFRFSHRSIMEYLIARSLFDEIKSRKPEAFARLRLDLVVAGFLGEMEPDVDVLWKWIADSKHWGGQNAKYAGGNAVTLLCMRDDTALVGKDLSGVRLVGTEFLAADLTRTEFSGAQLREVSLQGARFEEKTLREAEVSNCVLSVIVHLVYPAGESPERDPGTVVARFITALKGVSPKTELLAWSSFMFDPTQVIWHAAIRCADLGDLPAIRRGIASKSPVASIAVCASEEDRLLQEIPEQAAKHVQRMKERLAHRPF